MKSLSEIIRRNGVILNLKSDNRFGIINEILLELSNERKVDKNDIGDLLNDFINREKMVTTGIGRGVAVPHIFHRYITKLTIAVGLSAAPVDWDAMDGKPVYIVFLILSPEFMVLEVNNIFALCANLLQHREVREELRKCHKSSILSLIEKMEKRFPYSPYHW